MFSLKTELKKGLTYSQNNTLLSSVAYRDVHFTYTEWRTSAANNGKVWGDNQQIHPVVTD